MQGHEVIEQFPHSLDAVVGALLAHHDVYLALVGIGLQLGVVLAAQLDVRDQQVVDHLRLIGWYRGATDRERENNEKHTSVFTKKTANRYACVS